MLSPTPTPLPDPPSSLVPLPPTLPPVPQTPLVPPNPPLSSSSLAPPLQTMNPSVSQQSTTQKRHRCYPESMKGPFEVFIRQKENPINVLLISAEVYKSFRTIKEIKQVNFRKVRMVFSDRMEANKVVYNELLSRLYRVYIPSEKVEVDGVIHQADLDLNYLVEEGLGKFKDPRVSQVSILDCQQLAEAHVEGGVKTYSASHSIRVTFEGLILPNYVELNRALIPVRVFAPKVMHCSKCNKFGHTHLYCSNKACCGKCGSHHTDESCPVQEPACLHCKELTTAKMSVLFTRNGKRWPKRKFCRNQN